ncbi:MULTISPECIES: penicillin-binding protein activator [unclassified Luteimonas]|uniref:penicillin-binding protein activator n=1 Tax=unclassified Luteimonas TaxID=2629088 RepID=UPI0018F10533|nr:MULTISPECIES: penicillin-binding protein activator [unclassified Luteimonas]MBJ6981404.1 penicillin-binding protein activator [Luteimonas sp. MC1572]MBJ7576030.1 penicillin-binding protein activator [Luteimonas sp. MC1828]QQO02716.1 penicillin-binding protein activator [Luteimonas sp. MC1572]
MRHSWKQGLAATIASVALAGCAAVQVSTPAAPVQAIPEATRNIHWRFDDGGRPPAERDGYRPPLKLAVLLPLTGSLATASAPVRDGLLAGYYGERRRRPDLEFYDTAGTAHGAVAAYQRAVAEGADQVVGPLGRDEVDAVFVQTVPSVPLLALNRAGTPPPNAASYALAPEDEGSGAADFLAARNALRVLVLSSGDDSARRSIDAFTTRLQSHGGSVVQLLAVVGDAPGDMTALMQGALQREGGVDAVFMALRGPQARLVAPQVAAAGLATRPRVATSQIMAGTGRAGDDAALDGIAFPSDAWSVTGVPGLPAASSVAASLPTARGPAARLFAFGYDAWLLTAYLEHLATSPDASVPSASGTLRMDGDGNVLRSPAWSTFSGGHVVPLAGVGG